MLTRAAVAAKGYAVTSQDAGVTVVTSGGRRGWSAQGAAAAGGPSAGRQTMP